MNGVQFAKAKEKTIDERFPYLEFVYPGVKEIQKMPSPRLIKTHLPYSMLPVELQSGKGRVSLNIYPDSSPGLKKCMSKTAFRTFLPIQTYSFSASFIPVTNNI